MFFLPVFFPLPAVPPGKFLVNLVEHLPLADAPQGADQLFPVPVAGEPLDYHLGRQKLQLVADHRDIFLPGEQREFPRPVLM